MNDNLKRLAIARYYKMLQTSRAATLDRRVIASLRKGLEERAVVAPPIRLQLIADQFSIQAAPVLCSDISGDGRIEFNKEIGKFVILLRKDMPATRAKFTYAHEFVHSFFFVNELGTRKRVLELVVSEFKGLVEKSVVLSTLTTIEEERCNRIAGEILAPTTYLIEHLSQADFLFDRFPGCVERFARTFGISPESFMTRLTRVPVPAPVNWFASLVGRSTSRFRGGMGRDTLRLKCIIGCAFKQLKIPFYPGISLKGYGKLFQDSLQLLFDERPPFGTVRSSESQILTGFRKYDIELNATSLSKSPQSQLLIWGSIT